MGQEVQRRWFGAAVNGGNSTQNVFLARFRVFNIDVEVTIFGESGGQRVEQLILVRVTPALLVFSHQIGVWKGHLGIFVEHLHVAVRRRASPGKSNTPSHLRHGCLQARSSQTAVPLRWDPARSREQRQGRSVLGSVANAADAIFVPAISAATGMVMGEIVPGGAIRAVIFTHRAPCSVGDVRAPLFPIRPAR